MSSIEDALDAPFLDGPHERGCFCHNLLCALSNIDKVPDDFIGPLDIDFGSGEREVNRALVVVGKDQNRTAWLCDICRTACEIQAGIQDPRDLMPLQIQPTSQILRPG